MRTRLPGNLRGAFTLVELLVVIGIIALLISILLPSLNKARAAANQVACASNMRQVGLAMILYTNDHKGLLPYAYVQTATTQVTWDDLLNKYVGNNLTDAEKDLGIPQKPVNVMLCPSDGFLPRTNFSIPSTEFPRSYAVPLMWPAGPPTSPATASLTLFDRLGTSAFDSPNPFMRSYKLTETGAAGTLLLVEYPHADNVLGNASGTNVYAPFKQADNGTRLPVHNRKWNYLFADAHVEWIDPIDTRGVGSTYPTWCYGPWTRKKTD